MKWVPVFGLLGLILSGQARAADDTPAAFGALTRLRSGNVHVVQRDTSATNLKSLEAQLEADEASRDATLTQLSYTEIRAPVSGRIGSINSKAGTIVRVADNTATATLGYNWRGFSDKDISNEYTNQGWVLGLRYKFDEDLFRGKDAGVNKTLSSGSPAQP